MDKSAKMLITTWIDQVPRSLNDYSIVSGRACFRFLFASVEEQFNFQMDVLTGKKTRDAAHAAFMDKMVRDELAFAGNGKIYSAKPAGDTLAVANRVMNTHREMLDALSAEEKHSSGSPWELQQGSPLQFDVTDQVTASGTYNCYFPVEEWPQRLENPFCQIIRG